MKLHFLVTGDINALTGGYLYNKKIAEGLTQRGFLVQMISLPGPESDKQKTENECLAQFRKLERGSHVLADSLVMGTLHRVIRKFRDRLDIVGLVHLPVTFDPVSGDRNKILAGFELEAMNNVRHLIVTGRYMMKMLVNAGVSPERISLVEPGVDNFPRKQDYALLPYELLCISNYSPLKAQLVLIKALSRLRNRNWSLQLYGNRSTGREYLAELESRISNEKLADRVRIHDKLDHGEITAPFLKSDLFVLPSLFESYGMVLTESLAHGIPVVTTMGGNIPETVPSSMGIFTRPGNAEDLTSALDELFTDQKKYSSLCKAASGYYRQARPWKSAVDEWERILR